MIVAKRMSAEEKLVVQGREMHDEMIDLLESLDNARDVLLGSEHSVAMGRPLLPEDLKLWKALRRFVGEWRNIAEEVSRKAGIA
jgi:hypothetical protein